MMGGKAEMFSKYALEMKISNRVVMLCKYKLVCNRLSTHPHTWKSQIGSCRLFWHQFKAAFNKNNWSEEEDKDYSLL